MKRKKLLYLTTLAIMLSLLLNSTVFASSTTATTKANNSLCKLSIKATVPSDFDKPIVFVFTQKESGFKYQYELNKNNQYTGSVTIYGTVTYMPTVTFAGSEDFTISGLEDSYSITTAEKSISFSVKKTTYSANSQTATVTSSNQNGENTEAQQVYNKYIETVSFMASSAEYKNFLALYGSAIMKEYYLNADSQNTESNWQKMSDFDKWNYYITYVRPKTLLVESYRTFKSDTEMLDQFASDSNLLNLLSNGTTVIDAVREVWKWEYMSYQKTGTFPNLYDNYSNTSAKQVSDVPTLADDSTTQKNTLIQQKTFLEFVISHIFTIVICLIAMIGLGIFYIKKKRKESKSNNIIY